MSPTVIAAAQALALSDSEPVAISRPSSVKSFQSYPASSSRTRYFNEAISSSPCSYAGRLGCRGEFAGDDSAQQRTKLRRAFRAKIGFELCLRLRPRSERGLQTSFACIGQV